MILAEKVSMLILGIMVAFGSLGGVLGLFWRWRLWPLLAASVAVGFLISVLAVASSPRGTFSDVIADASAGGLAWTSYLAWWCVFFLYTGVPMTIGGAIGNCIRARRIRVDREPSGRSAV